MALSKDDVVQRFGANLGRVRSLIGTYAAVVGSGSGRPSVQNADVLRAAVILLHAALEDLLCSVEELELPTARPEAFDGMRLVPPGASVKDGKEKFSLKDLAAFRGQSVRSRSLS